MLRRIRVCPRSCARHVQQQTVILALSDLVALAGVVFQALAVQYSDVAAAVLDQAFVLQLAGGGGDAFAAHAQHDGDQFLGHFQLIAGRTVQAVQQPAAQFLLDRAVAAADGVLGHLGEEGIGVAHQQLGQGAALVEGVAQELGLEAVAIAGALDHGAAGGAFAHEQRDTDRAFMADHGDLGGGAVFHHVQQGDDGGGGEINVFEFAAVFEQFLAEGQRNQFQVLKQGFQVLARQGRKQLILLGAAVADDRTGRHFEFLGGGGNLVDRLGLLGGNTKLSVIHIVLVISVLHRVLRGVRLLDGFPHRDVCTLLP
jgi:hypothetical protein